MEAKKAVLIKTDGNGIAISGTECGELIRIYSADGRELRSAIAGDGKTTISVPQNIGELIIVKYGDRTVKIKL